MTQKNIEHRIRHREWPASSPELRARVLAEAPVARPVPWSDKVWFSGTFRWSVAAAFVAVIAVGARDRERPVALTMRAADAVRTVPAEAGLPEDAATSLARAMIARSPSTPSTRAMTLQQLAERGGGH